MLYEKHMEVMSQCHRYMTPGLVLAKSIISRTGHPDFEICPD